LPYLASQCGGAILASGLLRLLFPQSPTLGATLPAGSAVQSLVLEGLLTLILTVVVLTVSADRRDLRLLAGVIVGGVIGRCSSARSGSTCSRRPSAPWPACRSAAACGRARAAAPARKTAIPLGRSSPGRLSRSSAGCSVLGRPGTQILLGNESADGPMRSGGRIAMAYSLRASV
jgi:hypothetical protein